jgi:hypothetical protein
VHLVKKAMPLAIVIGHTGYIDNEAPPEHVGLEGLPSVLELFNQEPGEAATNVHTYLIAAVLHA